MEANVPQTNKPITPTTQDVSLGQVDNQLKYPFDYETQRALDEFLSSRIREPFPVGSIFINTTTTNPFELLGYGTWVEYAQSQVIVGYSVGDPDFGSIDNAGGERTHTLNVAELPAHTHEANNTTTPGGGIGSWGGGAGNTAISVSGSTGLGDAHNNLQPYIVAAIWKRTA